MDKLKVAWNIEEEALNIETFGVNFKEAKEVVLNSSSLKLPNLEKDFVFIGPVDDLSKVLVVNCKLEEGFRKIRWPGKPSKKKRTDILTFWPKEI